MVLDIGTHSDFIIFDDWLSYLHTALGYVAAKSGKWASVITLGFVAYQLSNHGANPETWPTTAGDVAEYVIGLGLGNL
jgi:hypothetical protein